MALFGFGKKEIVYFPGCFTSSLLKDKAENYRKIFKKIGTSFDSFDTQEMNCCGGILDEGGYEKELRKIAKENNQIFEEKGTKKIITNCPLCIYTLKKYKEIMPSFNVEIELIIKTIIEAILDNEKLVKNSFYERILYYDSCYLSRYLDFTEKPRELLKMFGYDVLDLKYSKEETLCCGSCGNLPITDSELSKDIATNFIKNLIKQATKLGVKKIVTGDPKAYFYLKQNLNALGIGEEQIRLLEISEVICDSLGIEKSE